MKSSVPVRNAGATVFIVIAAVCRAHAGTCADFAAPVWSYTPADGTDAIFTGTTDLDGNLYWIEFQPRLGTQQIVSASRDGSIRYRSDFDRVLKARPLETKGAVWADGMVLVGTEDNHFRALDAQTGALVWDTAVSRAGSYYGQLTDTGAGVLVVAVSYEGELSGIDLATGEELWTHSGETSVAAASGNIFLAERDANRRISLTQIDLFGMDIWSEPAGGPPVAVLGGETPLIVANQSGILVRERWWELPSVDVVVGADFGFLFSWRADRFQLQSFSYLAVNCRIWERPASRAPPCFREAS